MPGVELPHLKNDQRKKVEKFLVEQYQEFSKNKNDIVCIERLKLKLNFKDDNPVSQPYTVKFLKNFIINRNNIWKI